MLSILCLKYFHYLRPVNFFYSYNIGTKHQRARKSTIMRLFNLTKVFKSRLRKYSCIKHLLGELYYPNDLTQLKSILVEA